LAKNKNGQDLEDQRDQDQKQIDRIHKIYRIKAKTPKFFCLNLVDPVNPVYSDFGS